MKKFLILPALVACALSAPAAGRSYGDEMNPPRHNQPVRKAVDSRYTGDDVLAVQMARINLEAQKEENRHKEALVRAASARGSVAERKLPKALKEWTSEDLKYIKEKAREGNPEHQWHLGLAYAKGLGGSVQNYRLAADWYSFAADKGFEPAQKSLNFLREQEFI